MHSLKLNCCMGLTTMLSLCNTKLHIILLLGTEYLSKEKDI